MATITITLYDNEDGGVGSSASFDPRIDYENEDNITNAQKLGLAMLTYAFPPDRDDVTWSSRDEDKG